MNWRKGLARSGWNCERRERYGIRLLLLESLAQLVAGLEELRGTAEDVLDHVFAE